MSSGSAAYGHIYDLELKTAKSAGGGGRRNVKISQETTISYCV